MLVYCVPNWPQAVCVHAGPYRFTHKALSPPTIATCSHPFPSLIAFGLDLMRPPKPCQFPSALSHKDPSDPCTKACTTPLTSATGAGFPISMLAPFWAMTPPSPCHVDVSAPVSRSLRQSPLSPPLTKVWMYPGLDGFRNGLGSEVMEPPRGFHEPSILSHKALSPPRTKMCILPLTSTMARGFEVMTPPYDVQLPVVMSFNHRALSVPLTATLM